MVLSQTYTPPYVLNYALVIVNARESVLDGGQFMKFMKPQTPPPPNLFALYVAGSVGNLSTDTPSGLCLDKIWRFVWWIVNKV